MSIRPIEFLPLGRRTAQRWSVGQEARIDMINDYIKSDFQLFCSIFCFNIVFWCKTWYYIELGIYEVWMGSCTMIHLTVHPPLVHQIRTQIPHTTETSNINIPKGFLPLILQLLRSKGRPEKWKKQQKCPRARWPTSSISNKGRRTASQRAPAHALRLRTMNDRPWAPPLPPLLQSKRGGCSDTRTCG